jgi:hypothetical protein
MGIATPAPPSGRRFDSGENMNAKCLEQTIREIVGPLFFAVMSSHGREAEELSVGVLRSALPGSTDPIAQ